MSTKYVLALDQGTTSSRAILFDNEQNIIAVQQREFEQIYPQQGWVEHNPMEIWSTQYGVMNEVVAQSGVDAHDIAAIGITNQRETTILWEKATGRPIYNAIVWQCRRTAPLVDELLQQPGMADYIRENTGLMPDAYFSATKIKWILDNVPGARERAEAGEILFGTVDTWLVWKLTGGRVHVTDRTNASRTMLYNIRTLDWDDTLLKALDIPRCILPRVHGVKEEISEKGDTTFAYKIATNPEIVKQLKGHLMLVHGDIDNNVHPANTIRVVDALIRANKRFDMLLLPGQRHGFGDMNEYFYWRLVDFFSEHLKGKSETSVDIPQR